MLRIILSLLLILLISCKEEKTSSTVITTPQNEITQSQYDTLSESTKILNLGNAIKIFAKNNEALKHLKLFFPVINDQKYETGLTPVYARKNANSDTDNESSKNKKRPPIKPTPSISKCTFEKNSTSDGLIACPCDKEDSGFIRYDFRIDPIENFESLFETENIVNDTKYANNITISVNSTCKKAYGKLNLLVPIYFSTSDIFFFARKDLTLDDVFSSLPAISIQLSIFIDGILRNGNHTISFSDSDFLAFNLTESTLKTFLENKKTLCEKKQLSQENEDSSFKSCINKLSFELFISHLSPNGKISIDGKIFVFTKETIINNKLK